MVKSNCPVSSLSIFTGFRPVHLITNCTNRPVNKPIMDSLFNASSGPEETTIHSLPGVGFKSPSTTDSLKTCTIGVSLENVLTATTSYPETYRWFVFRVTYRREIEARNLLKQLVVLCYVPTYRISQTKGGHLHWVEKSMLTNLVFALVTEEQAATLLQYPLSAPDVELRKGRVPIRLHYLYDHITTNKSGRNSVICIPRPEMENFIRFTQIGRENIRMVSEGDLKIQRDEMVEGDFKGIKGRVVRISRQTCLLVDLRPVCLFASAYIPKGYLRLCPEEA